jgi:5-methylcytosine-specific restriction endonuclease McrBC GTP-binding regulatory subunit McrB
MYDRLNNNYIDPYSVTKLITQAYFDRKNPYILLLDEINLQDIEKYFPYFLDMDKILKD